MAFAVNEQETTTIPFTTDEISQDRSNATTRR